MIGATLSHYRTVKHRGINWPMPPWCTLGANEANFTQSAAAMDHRRQHASDSAKPLEDFDLCAVMCGWLLSSVEVNS